ncbi:CapA family protein [Demequina soli]|uniref:CapA family protein n=1 Tax=Demequina soli TaxID=1638987 RepID=UPI0009E54881|nr:CapA family protein [Demequina soli]
MPPLVGPGHARRRGARLASAAVAVLVAAAGFSAGLLSARQLSPADTVAAAPTEIAAPVASSTRTPSPEPSVSVTPSPEPPEPVRFTLVAAGDVLPHTPVDDSASTAGGYDFTALMTGVRPYIEGADVAICHMEVPVAPKGVAPSGYPIFSAPSALVRDLAAVGWDGCSTASNHSVDRGTAGVDATLAAFERNGLQHAGTARDADEAAQTAFYDVRAGDRTVRVAHVSFAYGTNGMPVAHPWEVNLFDADAADASPIIAAAKKARRAGADVVVASVHCCVEYRTAPTDAQREIARQIARSGQVDLYIGHHAHVPQPIELLPGGPSGTGMWTAFGLGNFLSNQDGWCCVADTASGELLSATFTVDPDGAVAVDVGWTPITVDRRDSHAMHVLTDIPDGAGTLSAAEVATRLAAVRAAAGEEAPEVDAPVTALADEVTTTRAAKSS